MTLLRRFLSTSSSERCLFAVSLVAMAASRLAIILFPLRRILGGMNAFNRCWPVASKPSLDLHRAARRITQAASYCPTTCLSRTLAAHFVLSRLGHASVPRIGVSKENGRFAAHAWLECADNIVIGDQSPDENRYHPVPSLERFFT
jgi:hypothetical protein